MEQKEISLAVSDEELGLTGFLVVEQTRRGPGKGGLRLAPSVTLEEVGRLAATMTWKNSLFELPFGGAKSGIVWSGGTIEQKEQLIRAFARKVRHLVPEKYIFGPDVSTGAREMDWIADELGCWEAATGKSSDNCVVRNGLKQCGLPHELGSTGFGVAVATMVSARLHGLKTEEVTVGIHGFGNVGTFAAKHLIESGYRVVLLADSKQALHRPDGFYLPEIETAIRDRQRLDEIAGERLAPEEFWALPMDILIPASVTNVINEANKNQLKSKIIVEGANIPMTESTENELHQRGVIIVPDFVANGGGIISSYAELEGLNPEVMLRLVEEKITQATTAVMTESLVNQELPRTAALRLASARALDHKSSAFAQPLPARKTV